LRHQYRRQAITSWTEGAWENFVSDISAAGQCVRTDRIGKHIAVITLNRPAVRNAVNQAVAVEVNRFVLSTESDPKIRVVIITGAGTTFCSGGDLKEISETRNQHIPRHGGFAGLTEARRTKPWIAAVNGSAFGGGVEIMLACEMAVISETAQLAIPEVRRGLIALGGGAIRLPNRIPAAIAAEILITGDPISAQRAYELGLVNRVVRADLVMNESQKLAESVASNSPYSVRETLRLLHAAVGRPFDEIWRENQIARVAMRESHDFEEGPLAFLEKREPRWKDY
jgi:enoyl-CoA hydratase/carnithine racemase